MVHARSDCSTVRPGQRRPGCCIGQCRKMPSAAVWLWSGWSLLRQQHSVCVGIICCGFDSGCSRHIVLALRCCVRLGVLLPTALHSRIPSLHCLRKSAMHCLLPQRKHVLISLFTMSPPHQSELAPMYHACSSALHLCGNYVGSVLVCA